jgi:hypothetical protein
MWGKAKARLLLNRQQARLRFSLLPIICLAIQAWLVSGGGSIEENEALRRTLFPLTYAGLLAFVWFNRWSAAIIVIGIGLAMNFIVIIANGGLMPITPEAIAESGLHEKAERAVLGDPLVHSKDVVLLKEDTRLWPLSDIIVIENPSNLRIFSPGDVVIGFGLLIVGPLEAAYYYATRNKRAIASSSGEGAESHP